MSSASSGSSRSSRLSVHRQGGEGAGSRSHESADPLRSRSGALRFWAEECAPRQSSARLLRTSPEDSGTINQRLEISV
ncbi:hypothetical protein SKAU_G00170960 [Synaphobranchus kaupii]|uniref:Uncharacterized protein n=1 Tax=Synaphobranchus kaupii TaxID=118154 RepID=A0A9Q1IZT1_SYNKA|nr:hypothetical protein SKAU_G00170960 [Synaphobranchus kaupii]